jgi:hypothetical protein
MLTNGWRVVDEQGQWIVQAPRSGKSRWRPVGYHADRDAMIRQLRDRYGMVLSDEVIVTLRALPAIHLGPGRGR